MTDTERDQLAEIMRDAIAAANGANSLSKLYDCEGDAVIAINAALAAGWRFLPPVDGR